MLLPKQMPVIFTGKRCTAFAFLTGSVDCDGPTNGKVLLRGKIKGEEFSHTVTFDINADAVAAPGQFIHRMAIKDVIKDLEIDEKDSDDKKREIIIASSTGNIISKYTSFVGVDKVKNEKVGEAETHFIRSPYAGALSPQVSSGNTELMRARALPTSFIRKAVAFIKGIPLPSIPPVRKSGRRLQVNDCCVPPSSMRQSMASRPSSFQHHIFGNDIGCCVDLPGDDEDGHVEDEECLDDICANTDAVRTFSPPIKGSAMVMLQEFDGSWYLTQELAQLVSVSKHELENKAPIKDIKIWATAVAVSWLTFKCSEERSEWEIVVSKARDWLLKQLGGQIEVDKLLKDVEESVFSA